MGANIKTVEVVANVASGSVGRDAPAQVEKILSDFGLSHHVWTPEPHELVDCLRAAVDKAPDLLVVLAGDGTARAAAELCGPDGPLIAPLPGGTMNMLPHAVYGVRPWSDALTLALEQGYEQSIGGGSVEGHSFLVAAILGSPALWAPAREAARFGKPRLAWMRARRAMRRTFQGRLRYMLDGAARQKAEAMVFICPLTSKALSSDAHALEAAALDVHGVSDLLRLGFHAVTGDWRETPGVETVPCRMARVWASRAIPAILDGETVQLKTLAEVRYVDRVARILAIPKDL
ncbi:diacylglycerol/lipid kinase family protein [Phenylobacterium sp.]|uniref:diacylglycerol/lipid kinase family protein n=1 Tax=Phenylobacterium sp. TaxID=1871053 RepID=UPI002E35F0F1|nr:diacylglycerol kinase family protein [Phenylobacterium sp.]HEX3364108.1 diacylglycerol kinase family protein [Phenylobacterium sp.]